MPWIDWFVSDEGHPLPKPVSRWVVRLAEGIFHLEHYDRSWYSFGVRCYFIADGLFHGVFAVILARALFAGSGDADNDDAARQWTAHVLVQPFGRWLVGLAGVATAAGGLYLFLRVYWRPFLGELKRNRLPTGVAPATVSAACAGEAARGLIFVIIGIFLTRAAIRVDPDETRDLGAAMAELASQPFGPLLLGLVAAGFILYGLYSMIEARYRRIGRGLVEADQQTA